MRKRTAGFEQQIIFCFLTLLLSMLDDMFARQRKMSKVKYISPITSNYNNFF